MYDLKSQEKFVFMNHVFFAIYPRGETGGGI